MKAISEDFKDTLKTYGREFEQELIIGEDTLTNENIYKINLSYEGDLLKSIMKQLTVEVDRKIEEYTEFRYKLKLKVNGEYEAIDYGLFYVKSCEKKEDTNTYQIIAYDRMISTMQDYFFYDNAFPMTLGEYVSILAQLITRKPLANTTFVNSTRVLPKDYYKDLKYTFRDVLDEIAQATASTIVINSDEKLELKYFNNQARAIENIDEDYFKDTNVNFKNKIKINKIIVSRVNETDGIEMRDDASIPYDGEYCLHIKDNQILSGSDRESYLTEIFNEINGLEYYLNDYESYGILYLEPCDVYYATIKGKNYKCLMLNDEINIGQGVKENVFTDKPYLLEEELKNYSKTEKSENKTQLTLDKQSQTIEALASSTTENTSKIAQLRIDVNRIEGEITEIADITTSADGMGEVELENVADSEPILIKVRPSTSDIRKLYPQQRSLAHDPLKSGTIKSGIGKALAKQETNNFGTLPSLITYPTNGALLTFETGDNVITYTIPTDLYVLNSEVYDEFIIDNEEQECYVYKKVGFNNKGQKIELATPEKIEFDYPTIHFELGDLFVYCSNLTAYIFVRAIANNIYTNQFATKIELNSKISQTAREIDLEVDEKLEDYSTTTEMNSAINLSAQGITSVVSTKVGKTEVISSINQTAEAIKINANKIDITGTITAINGQNTTTIDGSKITTGSITGSQISANSITSDKINVGGTIITTSNISTQSISADQITGGTINGNNVNVSNLNASNITAGTLSVERIPNISAGKITSGTMSADRISGGTLSIGNSNYYLRMGANWTKNPECSGLTIGSHGLRVNSGIDILSTGTIRLINSSGQQVGVGSSKNVSLTYMAGLNTKYSLTLYFQNGLYFGYDREQV